MTTVLERASRECSSRAADERFGSLSALHSAAVDQRKIAADATVNNEDIYVTLDDTGEDLRLAGSEGKTAALTNWSFGQLCRQAESPASFVKELPADLAADVLNNRLATKMQRVVDEEGDPGKSLILFANNGGDLTARALTSRKYGRIWNSDITSRLIKLEDEGPWQPAPAAFDGSRGLYMGDRDMFAFMVDNERRIFEKQEGGLSRGFFCWNSEVGAASFGIMTFLYEYVCGNHRVWGATEINELRIRHVGDTVDERAFSEMQATLIKYAESSASEDEAKIERARSFTFGNTKDEVLDAIFGLRVTGLSQTMIMDAYDKAEERVDWYGDPRSAWGIAGGMTEIARDLPYADDRVTLDRAAAKIMAVAF